MFRVLTGFLLLMMIGPASNGQSVKQPPVFKNGLLESGNNLLNHKLNHPSWLATRFGNDYFVVVQLSNIPDDAKRAELSGKGISLKQSLGGHHWLAICNGTIPVKMLPGLGIKNIYAIPPSVKWNDLLP